MPGSNSRPNVSEGYEVPTELPGSTGTYSTENKIKIEGYYRRGVDTLLYSTENKIKIEGYYYYYYYCRGVLSGAAIAPPALHLRENTRSRRQGRRHDPLGRTICGLDQPRANRTQYNADPHLQLYSCRIVSCSIRSHVVCETKAQPRQTNTTSVGCCCFLHINRSGLNHIQ